MEIDTQAQTVHRGSKKIALPDLSFKVFVEILKAAPEPITSVELATRAWSSTHVTDETIAQRITLLRRKLGDDSKDPDYVKTVRGVGYAVASPVRLSNRSARSKKTLYSIAASVLALLLVTASVLLQRNEIDIEKTKPSAADQLVKRAQDQLQVQQADATDRAVQMLREALHLEPDSTPAKVALSFALSTRSTKFSPHADDAVEAERLARSVLGEQESNSPAWHALGYALDAQGRIDEALASYRHAYEIDPEDIAAISSAAYLLSVRGQLYDSLLLEARGLKSTMPSRYVEIQIARTLELVGHPAAERWKQRARLLNPDQVVIIAEQVSGALHAKKPEEAMKLLQTAGEITQNSTRLLRLKGRALLATKQMDQARATFLAAGDRAQFELAALDGLQGDIAAGEATLAATQSDLLNGNSWPGMRIQMAEVHAALMQSESATKTLAQAVDLGWRDVAAVESSPFLQALTQSKAWKTIRERINRELEGQRRLIENDVELMLVLQQP